MAFNDFYEISLKKGKQKTHLKIVQFEDQKDQKEFR